LLNGKINLRKLLAMVDSGHSQTEIARAFGVSRQAVSKELKRLRGKNTRVTVCKKLERVVDERIDALAQLQRINSKANEILNQAMERFDEGETWGKEREIALKAMSEIRSQLALQIELFKTLFSLQAAGEFMNEVLEVLEQTSPELRARVIAGLQKKRGIASVATFT
jgi:predicted transcriptional regulator